ncbi:hypothetical protein JVX90_02605 [Gordonia sp. PDNC005]|uniref:hypothetical protein n=1 Tax=unclassified Gordonia (in: high G+C Gram-positive bacteria) TaxID=2657482 RepID=UPI001964AFFA|nr:hypothetical protein [Gordonia sp. PDNC005]QRY63155.1 hypothetical protein JVX90_02605 [Gordonia sp. PDNC005]
MDDAPSHSAPLVQAGLLIVQALAGLLSFVLTAITAALSLTSCPTDADGELADCNDRAQSAAVATAGVGSIILLVVAIVWTVTSHRRGTPAVGAAKAFLTMQVILGVVSILLALGGDPAA